MGLDNLIADNTFYYSVYLLSLGIVGLLGSMIVHTLDVKTRKFSRYPLENEGENHYNKRLALLRVMK